MAESYKKVAKEISDHVKEKRSTGYSKGDSISLMQAIVNDNDGEFTVITKKANKPVANVIKPAKKLRESLEPTLVSVGLDKSEAKEAAQKIVFNKKTAEALVDISDLHLKTYLDTGRKYSLPLTSTEETKMSLSKVTLDEKVEQTRRPVKNETTGETTMEFTGKTIKTKKRGALKAKNVVPPWLKNEI